MRYYRESPCRTTMAPIARCLSLFAFLLAMAMFNASLAMAATKKVTYVPPAVSDMSAADLEKYYDWRNRMDWILAPIHTRADLEKYLKDTSKSGSPLDALSPDVRKRLLSELEFGSHGVFLPYYGDLQYLSTQQVYKILALFGEQRLAVQFTGGRIRAASPRAASQPGKPSLVEQRFAEYLKSQKGTQAEQAEMIERDYAQWFSPLQTPGSVRKIGSHDLRLLFRAASIAAFYTHEEKYAQGAQVDFAEMEKRHFSGWPDYQAMYEAFVDTRQFVAARKFYLTHLDAGLTAFPAYSDEAKDADKNAPTVLVVSTTQRELIHRRVDLDKPTLVIILTDPHCHFCEVLDQALQSRPKLHAILDQHGLWLALPGAELEFDTLQLWNKAHPSQRINIMYRLQGWPMVKTMAVPQFFFLRDGKVVAHHMGWGSGDNSATLESGLKAIGLWK